MKFINFILKRIKLERKSDVHQLDSDDETKRKQNKSQGNNLVDQIGDKVNYLSNEVSNSITEFTKSASEKYNEIGEYLCGEVENPNDKPKVIPPEEPSSKKVNFKKTNKKASSDKNQ